MKFLVTIKTIRYVIIEAGESAIAERKVTQVLEKAPHHLIGVEVAETYVNDVEELSPDESEADYSDWTKIANLKR